MTKETFPFQTLLAWAPVAWLCVTAGGLWLATTLMPDWPCGPPGGQTCDIYGHHPVVLGYVLITAPIAGLCLVASLGWAVRRKPNIVGWIGIAMSIVLAGLILAAKVFGS